jgi:hypothetical protein
LTLIFNSNIELTEWEFVPASSWVSGFLPGMMWYMHEYNKKKGNAAAADKLASDLVNVELTPVCPCSSWMRKFM